MRSPAAIKSHIRVSVVPSGTKEQEERKDMLRAATGQTQELIPTSHNDHLTAAKPAAALIVAATLLLPGCASPTTSLDRTAPIGQTHTSGYNPELHPSEPIPSEPGFETQQDNAQIFAANSTLALNVTAYLANIIDHPEQRDTLPTDTIATSPDLPIVSELRELAIQIASDYPGKMVNDTVCPTPYDGMDYAWWPCLDLDSGKAHYSQLLEDPKEYPDMDSYIIVRILDQTDNTPTPEDTRYYTIELGRGASAGYVIKQDPADNVLRFAPDTSSQ